MSEHPRRVALVGPTASGKSAVAMAVALERGDIELVSVDSMQVYRGMDIGTATPTAAEQQLVRHHLIDLIEPTQEFTVAEFQSAYRGVVREIEARGHRPLLVGGTGLYHRAAIDDLEIPGEWPDVRARLDAEAAEIGPTELWDRLALLDPVAADKIEPTNTRRIVRALEVCEGSERPFSSYGPGLDAYPNDDAPDGVIQIGLTVDRAVIAERIARRVHDMIDAGFVDECARLDRAHLSRTARQAIGYRELFAYLDGETDLTTAIEAVVTRTRQFAVRQIRWFQRDPRVRWVDVGDDPVVNVVPVVLEALA